MRKSKSGALAAIALTALVLFGLSLALETSAWARAGGGRSFGSRGGRSFSSPSMPSRTSPSNPGLGTPGQTPLPASPGGFSGSPFWHGIAGGLAGGFLGNMLFGGRSYGSGPMGTGGSGIGLFDLLIIGALIYFGLRYFRRRQGDAGGSTYYYQDNRTESLPGGSSYYGVGAQPPPLLPTDEARKGLDEIRRLDTGFNEESFKETVEDLFFRIQAAWMNRNLDGTANILTPEMAVYFSDEFAKMKQQGRINRLENIAVRKVEFAEAWQESGKDYITVFFTANLLDYTVDDQSGQVVQGDKLNPVKFQEFWTFCRDIGTGQWQLAGINQIGEPSPH